MTKNSSFSCMMERFRDYPRGGPVERINAFLGECRRPVSASTGEMQGGCLGNGVVEGHYKVKTCAPNGVTVFLGSPCKLPERDCTLHPAPPFAAPAFTSTSSWGAVAIWAGAAHSEC